MHLWSAAAPTTAWSTMWSTMRSRTSLRTIRSRLLAVSPDSLTQPKGWSTGRPLWDLLAREVRRNGPSAQRVTEGGSEGSPPREHPPEKVRGGSASQSLCPEGTSPCASGEDRPAAEQQHREIPQIRPTRGAVGSSGRTRVPVGAVPSRGSADVSTPRRFAALRSTHDCSQVSPLAASHPPVRLERCAVRRMVERGRRPHARHEPLGSSRAGRSGAFRQASTPVPPLDHVPDGATFLLRKGRQRAGAASSSARSPNGSASAAEAAAPGRERWGWALRETGGAGACARARRSWPDFGPRWRGSSPLRLRPDATVHRATRLKSARNRLFGWVYRRTVAPEPINRLLRPTGTASTAVRSRASSEGARRGPSRPLSPSGPTALQPIQAVALERRLPTRHSSADSLEPPRGSAPPLHHAPSALRPREQQACNIKAWVELFLRRNGRRRAGFLLEANGREVRHPTAKICEQS